MKTKQGLSLAEWDSFLLNYSFSGSLSDENIFVELHQAGIQVPFMYFEWDQFGLEKS